MRKLKLFLSLLVLVTISIGNVWATADPVVLFHESFGDNSSSARDWSDSYSVKSGVSTVYSGITGYTVSNAKQGKNTTGSTKSGLNQSTAGTDASIIIGPLNVSGYNTLKVTYQWKAASVKGTYSTKLEYKTSSTGTLSEVSGTGDGATGFVERSYNLPEAAQVSTLYLKITWNTSNTQAIIDEVELTGVAAGSPDPTVSVDPSPIAFGNVKQYSEGPLGTPYVFKNFTVTGENLTSAITVTAPAGAIFDLWNVATETTIGTSIELEPDGNGAVEKELAIMAATAWSGAQNSSITISGDDLDEDMTVNITMNVTPRYSVDVEVNNDEMGTATINGGSVAHVENDSEELTLVATPKPGYEFVNWTYDDTKVLLTDDDEASTTAYAYEEVTVTANFQAMSCSSLAAPVYKGYYTTYQTLRINWEAVENASSYLVNIKQGETPIVEDASTTELLYVKTGLTANTEYTITVMAVGDGTTYCDENNPVLEKTYTLPDYPDATLTLSENGETRAWGSELKVASVIALPTAVAEGNEVAGKVFVGWDPSATCATAPTYAPGADYTIASTEDILYAVYAKETPGANQTYTLDYTDDGVGDLSLGYGNAVDVEATDGSAWVVKAAKNTGMQINASKNSSIKIPTCPGNIVSIALTCNSGAKNAVGFSASDYTGGAIADVEYIVYSTQNSESQTLNFTGKTVKAGYIVPKAGNCQITNIVITYAGASTYTKYATTGAKAPSATVVPTSVALEATAVVGGLIDVTYSNVDAANVAVALFDDEACENAFSGEWLNVSLDVNNDIEYGAAAAVSYVNTRKAYIKLTAPSPAEGVDPAVVVIPVTQAKKEAVFDSFEALVASDLAEDSATVSFENIAITGFYKTVGVYLNVKGANDKDIEIYRSGSDIPASWVVGGTLSGTVRGKWTYYTDGDVWEIVPKYGWEWTNLTYKAPSATSIDNTEAEAQAVKVVENGQIFIIRGDKTFNAQGQLVK